MYIAVNKDMNVLGSFDIACGRVVAFLCVQKMEAAEKK
jgi:hypothetical protein